MQTGDVFFPLPPFKGDANIAVTSVLSSNQELEMETLFLQAAASHYLFISIIKQIPVNKSSIILPVIDPDYPESPNIPTFPLSLNGAVEYLTLVLLIRLSSPVQTGFWVMAAAGSRG